MLVLGGGCLFLFVLLRRLNDLHLLRGLQRFRLQGRKVLHFWAAIGLEALEMHRYYGILLVLEVAVVPDILTGKAYLLLEGTLIEIGALVHLYLEVLLLLDICFAR